MKVTIHLFFMIASFIIFPSYGKVFLNFPADKNQVQILSQRFEYGLLDADRLKIGDILIDGNQVGFQLQSISSKNIQIEFFWPTALLKTGEIILKDNNGKAIYRKYFQPQDIKYLPKSEKNDNNLREEVGSLLVTSFPEEILEDMKYMPFMNLCLFREEGKMKILFCSKELYLSSKDGQVVVKPRNSTRTDAKVEINGKRVMNEVGAILLSKKNEPVSFKSQAPSGSVLEIETLKREVDFYDVTTSLDKSELVFKATGAEPVDESKIRRISESEWEINVPIDRPVLYLQGEGGIPMRQEFYLKKQAPPAELRLSRDGIAQIKTYSSQIQIKILKPKKVESLQAEKKDLLQTLANDNFLWTIKNLGLGTQRSYLQMQSQNQTYYSSVDISRGFLTDLRFYIGSRSNMDLQIQMNPFLHFGGYLGYRSMKSSKTFSAAFFYQFFDNIHLQDQTLQAGVEFHSVSQDEGNWSRMNIFSKFLHPLQAKQLSWFDFWQIECRMQVASIGSAGNGSSYFLTSTSLDTQITSRFHSEIGFEVEFSKILAESKTSLGVNMGLGYQF